MAKQKETPAGNPTDQELYEQMLEGLSPEERAMLDKVTGQDNLKGGSKTPVIRVSYKESDDVDVKGKSVKKGNFVLGQKTSYDKEGNETIDEIGIDLGAELTATILAMGNQYSFYSQQKGQSCSSQVVRERGEVPVGSTNKCVCNDGSCPRRKEGLDKKEKCTNQFVVFLRLPEGTKLPDGTDCPVAMLYVKGSSYMPFKDYMAGKGEKSLKVNSLMCKTIIQTTRQKQGSVVYYDLAFAQGPLDAVGFKENFALASEAMKALADFKDSNVRQLPAPEGSSKATVAGNGAGGGARNVTPGEGTGNIDW